MVFHPQGELNRTIVLQLLDDVTPEDKDEYRVSLTNIQTFGNNGSTGNVYQYMRWIDYYFKCVDTTD